MNITLGSRLGSAVLAALLASSVSAAGGGGASKPVIATDVQCQGCVGQQDIAAVAIGPQQIQAGAVASGQIATDSVDETRLTQSVRDRMDAVEAAAGRPRLVLVDGDGTFIGTVLDQINDSRAWLVLAEIEGYRFLRRVQSYFPGEVTLVATTHFLADGNCNAGAATVIAVSPTELGLAFLDPALYGFATATFAVVADTTQGLQQVLVNADYGWGNAGTQCYPASGLVDGYRAQVIRHNWQPPYRITVR